MKLNSNGNTFPKYTNPPSPPPKKNYNPWPIGHIPKHLQRPELQQLKDVGYTFNDPREVVGLFEQKVAEFAGSKYAVAVDCCTHAMELSLRYLLFTGEIAIGDVIRIPNHTYVSAALVSMQLGFKVEFENNKWSGVYKLTFPEKFTCVFDGAVRWKKGMYEGYNSLHCLSFQIKKRIPIGRVGMVLTYDKEAADWIRLAAYDGRDLALPYDHPDHVKMQGYHYYMTPEDCARGILLMEAIKDEGDTGGSENYPDVKQMLKL